MATVTVCSDFGAQKIKVWHCFHRFPNSVASNSLRLQGLQHMNRPGFPVCHQLLKLAQTHVHWVGDAIQPSHPLSSPSPAFNLSQHHGLFNESIHIRWPKYWSFSFSISPSNEYSGLISFRIYSFDLLAVHGTLWSLLQHHSSKASIFQHSALWCNSHIHTWLLEKP